MNKEKIDDYRPYSFTENFRYYIKSFYFSAQFITCLIPLCTIFITGDWRINLFMIILSLILLLYIYVEYFVKNVRTRSEICIKKEDIDENPFDLCLRLAKKYDREFGFFYDCATKKIISDIIVGSATSLNIINECYDDLLTDYHITGFFHTHYVNKRCDYDVTVSDSDLNTFISGKCYEMSIGHVHSGKYFVITREQVENDPIFWKKNIFGKKFSVKRYYDFKEGHIYCKKQALVDRNLDYLNTLDNIQV